jgi:hypothetical protein
MALTRQQRSATAADLLMAAADDCVQIKEDRRASKHRLGRQMQSKLSAFYHLIEDNENDYRHCAFRANGSRSQWFWSLAPESLDKLLNEAKQALKDYNKKWELI